MSRLKVVRLNGYKPPGEGVFHGCRHCEFGYESLPHVINHCRPLFHRGTEICNKIVKRFKDGSSHQWNILYENQPVRGTGLKVDLVLEEKDHVLIFNITCPFDDGIDKFNDAN